MSKQTERKNIVGKMTIGEEWKLFESIVVSEKAGELQRELMKQSFYAGAFVSQSMTMAIVENNTSEVAETILDRLYLDTETEVKKVIA